MVDSQCVVPYTHTHTHTHTRMHTHTQRFKKSIKLLLLQFYVIVITVFQQVFSSDYYLPRDTVRETELQSILVTTGTFVKVLDSLEHWFMFAALPKSLPASHGRDIAGIM